MWASLLYFTLALAYFSLRAFFLFCAGLEKGERNSAFTPWRRAQLIIVELLSLPSASPQYPVPASGSFI